MPSTKVKIYQDALKSIEDVLLLSDEEDLSKEEMIVQLKDVLANTLDRIDFVDEQQEMFLSSFSHW